MSPAPYGEKLTETSRPGVSGKRRRAELYLDVQCTEETRTVIEARIPPAVWRRILGNIERGDIVLSDGAGTLDDAEVRRLSVSRRS